MHSRRAFCNAACGALSFALLSGLWRSQASALPSEFARWLAELDRTCRDLGSHTITPVRWQTEVERLFTSVSLDELLASADVDKLAAGMMLPDRGVMTHRLHFPKLGGPRRFAAKVFGMKRRRAIIPHGHENMVSCHLVLRGELHARHYDRVADEPGHLVLAPSIDRVLQRGAATSVSSAKDNVHWFECLSSEAFTLDVIVDGLDAALGFPYRITFVDPRAATPLAGGRLRAPKLELEGALRKYGSS